MLGLAGDVVGVGLAAVFLRWQNLTMGNEGQTLAIQPDATVSISESLGVRAVSNFLNLPDERRSQGMLRGVRPQALRVHPKARLIKGPFPSAGKISAIFAAPGTVLESAAARYCSA